jgi:hypothetical protein
MIGYEALFCWREAANANADIYCRTVLQLATEPANQF